MHITHSFHCSVCFTRPPGSGKTTYCDIMAKHLKKKYGEYNVFVANMDPGNDLLPYKADVNVQELVTVDQVMDAMELGPNGAYIFAMEFIDSHLDRVIRELHTCCAKSDPNKPRWILFDMPGQVIRSTKTFINVKRSCSLECFQKFNCNTNLLQVELYIHVKTVKDTIKKLELSQIRLCTINLVDSHHCSDPGK